MARTIARARHGSARGVGRTGVTQMHTILVLLLAYPAFQKPAPPQERCSITIVLPRGWTAGKGDTSPDRQCVFGVIPREGWSRIRRENADIDTDPYPINITVFTRPV